MTLLVTTALFLLWYGASSLAIAWWDHVQDGHWSAVRQSQPLVGGRGQWRSGNWHMDLFMGPEPYVSQRTVRVQVTMRHAGRSLPDQTLVMRLKMPSMPSFDLAVRLKAQGNGVFTGTMNLPLCTGSPTPAILQVRCDQAGQQVGTGFRFSIRPPAWRSGGDVLP